MLYTIFKPTIEPIRVVIKKRRANDAGSLKKTMPRITVPTAPIPVQTGYAVLIGKDCTAFANKTMLKAKQTIKQIPQK